MAKRSVPEQAWGAWDRLRGRFKLKWKATQTVEAGLCQLPQLSRVNRPVCMRAAASSRDREALCETEEHMIDTPSWQTLLSGSFHKELFCFK